MSLFRLVAVLLVACAVVKDATAGGGGRFTTVYQKIARDQRLSQFYLLLQANRLCKASLSYREVTVFAPTNEAFRKFNGSLTVHLPAYHLAYGARMLTELDESMFESVTDDGPPLWVTKNPFGDVFVNNALVSNDSASFAARTRQDIYGKLQVLHVVDEVLDPVVRNSTDRCTAYEFLSQTQLWTSAYTTGIFFSGVIHNRLENLFKSEGNYTFFLPVDVIFGDYRVEFLDTYSIKAHIVPNRVLFTRPSHKYQPYETLTTGDYISVLVYIVEEKGKYFAKGNTILGDSNHQTGEITAEILLPNIPMKNGVIHVISKPLALYNKRLTKFPYLEVMDKFSMDPMLNTSYVMGLNSGFNEYLKAANKKFTFFVPRDLAWRRLRDQFDVQTILRPGHYNMAKSILERHLVIGEVPISMETLEKASTRFCVNLTTAAGRTCLSAKKDDSEYRLTWKGVHIVVSRPNYECSDGIVHIIDRPMMDDEDFAQFDQRTAISFVRIWKALQTILI